MQTPAPVCEKRMEQLLHHLDRRLFCGFLAINASRQLQRGQPHALSKRPFPCCLSLVKERKVFLKIKRGVRCRTCCSKLNNSRKSGKEKEEDQRQSYEAIQGRRHTFVSGRNPFQFVGVGLFEIDRTGGHYQRPGGLLSHLELRQGIETFQK